MKMRSLFLIYLLFLIPAVYTGCSDDIDPDPYGIRIDTDGDGVADISDRCPQTPAGTSIDEFGCPLSSEYTYIPDDDFEQILINQGYDTILDDFVLTKSINEIRELELPGIEGVNRDYSIKDLTGIEDFEALQSLTIHYGEFEANSIDLSQNTALTELQFICSDIDSLDLSQTNIEKLQIKGNLGFELCSGRVGSINVEGLETLTSFVSYFVEFGDLNSILNSAINLQEIVLTDPVTPNGPMDYLDLSKNQNLSSIELYSCLKRGPAIINFKDGTYQNLSEIILDAGSELCIAQEEFTWEPCIQTDEPSFIENIIQIPDYSYPLNYSVTTNCGA